MNGNEEHMAAKKELLEQRMKDRQKQIEAGFKKSEGANTEEMVRLFFADLDPEVSSIEQLMTNIETLPESEINAQLDTIAVKLQKLQDMVSDAGMFLPSFDSKKCQKTINDLNSRYQELVDKVKPKKKFGFKNKKQKQKVPEMGILSLTESGDGGRPSAHIKLDNALNVSSKSNESILLTSDQVQFKDVMVSGLIDCRLEIRGSPLTLHLTNITRCTILTGPVSTSIMIDQCQDSTLALACQQLRTHNTTNVTIYLHTTTKAIIEDCSNIRVAPYQVNYEGIDQDYKDSGLNRNTNNWNQIGDFNWLSVDKPSPNWSVLPQSERNLETILMNK